MIDTVETNLTLFRPINFLRYLRCIDVKGWPLSRRISPTSFGRDVDIVAYSDDGKHIKRVLFLCAGKVGDAVDGIDDPKCFDDPHKKSVLLVADSIAPNAGDEYVVPHPKPESISFLQKVLRWLKWD
jgi:hypothetical protein